MSRRERIDPETARLVEERLQWLLQEHGPGPVTERPPGSAALPTVPAAGSGPPRRSDAARRPGVAARSPEHPPDTDPEIETAEPETPLPRAPRPTPGGGLLTTVATFRRPHLIVVAVLVALGILVAGWAVLRARPVAVAVTPPAASSTVGGATSGRSTGASGAGVSPSAAVPAVVVHVLGAVREPGLVSVAAGSRVQDAIAAAGGLTGKADPGELNLAQAVTDGQQIVVGTKDKPAGEVRNGTAGGGSGGNGTGGSGAGPGRPLDLNAAGQAELEELPGVGPVMAGKILAWRTENGRFSRVEELQEIDGVGPKTYAKLAPLCRV
jgi:competence protein ComEA